MGRKSNLEKSDVIHIMVNSKEKDIIKFNSEKYNFRSISEYVRFISLNQCEINIKLRERNG